MFDIDNTIKKILGKDIKPDKKSKNMEGVDYVEPINPEIYDEVSKIVGDKRVGESQENYNKRIREARQKVWSKKR